jgi:hypothetical protein
MKSENLLKESNYAQGSGGSGSKVTNTVNVPEITLPKGGGAIKSIDDKFSVNPSNGTATFTVPFPLSPSRNAFMPQTVLTYNSGKGNSVFGLGWSANVPDLAGNVVEANNDEDEVIDQNWNLLFEHSPALREELDVNMLISYSLVRLV